MKGDNNMTTFNVETDLNRGDIIWCDFGKPTGSEQRGIRPAVIIQNNVGNKYSPCVIVIPVSSQWKKPMITHVGLKVEETGLEKPSVAMAEQIQTVDKRKITGKANKLSDRMMNCIDRAIMASLGLGATSINPTYSA